MHPSPETAILFRESFEDHTITFVSFRGEPIVVARELATSIGYADPGSLARLIRAEWSAEFEEGKDFRILTRDDLAAFKAEWGLMTADGTSSIDPRSPSLLILTESGLFQVAQKTEKTLGVKLRRFLTDKVLPKLARGEAISGGPKPGALSPVDVKLAIADRMLAANDKAGAKKVLRAAAVEVGVDFGRAKRVEAAPTAQLELPLPPAPTPAPTSPRPKWLRDAPPADGNDWSGLVRAWLSKYGFGAIVTSADLLQLGIVVPDSPNDAGRASRLGRALHKRIDTVIAGCRITHRNSTVRGYALQKA